MEDELLLINVWLSGRSYRLRVKPNEESAVRKAIKVAEEKVMEMRSQYAGKDDQDFLAMTLLTYAADSAIDILDNPLLRAELKELTTKIDKVITGQ